MSTLAERVNRFETELRRMHAELRLLQEEVGGVDAAVAPPPAPAAVGPAQPPRAVTPPAPSPPRPVPPLVDRARARLGRLAERLDLFGAGGLAVAGGAVTALGITLLFVLATEQGWLGPAARVLTGCVAAALVFAAGVVVRHRYGHLKAGLAAVAAGIVGGYASLAAAAALYGLLPDAAALVLAAAIAALAVGVALAWHSELVAALGLLGAALAPALEGLDGGITPIGVGFAVVVLVATGVIAVIRDWAVLLTVVAAVVGLQAAWLLALEESSGAAASLAATSAVAATLLAIACAWQLRGRARELRRLTTPFVTAAVGLTLVAAYVLVPDERDRGIALALAAVIVAVAWVGLRARQPDLGVVLAGAALTLGAVAGAGLLSGDGLTLGWAAEAALLVSLAHRFRDLRLQIAGIAYLVLAACHLLVVGGVPLGELVAGAGGDAAAAVPAAAVSLAAVAAALLAPISYRPTGERGILAVVAELAEWLEPRRARLVEALATVAACFALAAFGLLVVAVHAAAGAVAFTAAAAALTTVGTVVAAGRRAAVLAGVSYVGAILVAWRALVVDLDVLSRGWGGVAVLLAAVGLLATGISIRVCWRAIGRRTVEAALAATVALGSALVAVWTLAGGGSLLAAPDRLWFGIGVALVAAAYLGLAALTYRPRLHDLATTLWALGLVPLVLSELVLTSGGVAFAVALAVTSVAATAIAVRLADARVWRAALVLVALDAVAVLGELAPPDQLLTPGPSPASGVLGVVAVAAALAALAAAGPYARWFAAAAGALGVYALSLVVLEAVIDLSGAALETGFERGHTAVSVVWGVTGLTLLLVGILRRAPSLRHAGLVLFGITLGKIFLFDLAELSSVARAASFVGVGAMLLAGGFFVQRLGQRERARPS